MVSPAGFSFAPFAQWSSEVLGADFILPFALTNSGRLPSALHTVETLPSFAHSLTGRGFGSSRLIPTEKAPTRGAFSVGEPGGIRNAASIGVTPHRGDHLFRLTSEPTKFPPLTVVGSSPHDLLIRRKRKPSSVIAIFQPSQQSNIN